MYQNPAYDPKNKLNASQLQNHFDAFYEDFWCEMCKYGEIEEVVVCDNNNDRKSWKFIYLRKLADTRRRSDRKRVRALQVRGLGAKGLRYTQLALVRRSPDILRIEPGDGFPRGVLSTEQWRWLCTWGILQLHPPQAAQ
jgi:splicing factor U2AF subunit